MQAACHSLKRVFYVGIGVNRDDRIRSQKEQLLSFLLKERRRILEMAEGETDLLKSMYDVEAYKVFLSGTASRRMM